MVNMEVEAMRVFIFDNDPQLALTMAFALESEGHQVLTNVDYLPNGRTHIDLRAVEVLRKMLEWKPLPDVIIIECLEVDSEEFIRILRSTGLDEKMTILAMTHRYPNTKIERLMKHYGAFYMPKPLNVTRLVEYVHQLRGIAC